MTMYQLWPPALPQGMVETGDITPKPHWPGSTDSIPIEDNASSINYGAPDMTIRWSFAGKCLKARFGALTTA